MSPRTNTLTRRTLRRFLAMAGDRLTGEWIIMGGALLPILGIGRRVTVDIDVAGPPDSTTSQVLALMEIAQELGLPVEAINQAGAFFLYKINDWRGHIIPLHRGKGAIIYRPDVTLFVLLKLGRLSESDLSDCFEFLEFAGKRSEKPDTKRLVKEIRGCLKMHPHHEKTVRMKALLVCLGK